MFCLHFDQGNGTAFQEIKARNMCGHMSKLSYAIGLVSKTPIIEVVGKKKETYFQLHYEVAILFWGLLE